MTTTHNQHQHRRPSPHLEHGSVGYVQIPALDVTRSAAFYETVFGWSVDAHDGSFEAPGLIGQWATDRTPASASASASATGPMLWLYAAGLAPTLVRVVDNGGTVQVPPYVDGGGERWLAEIDDPAGNRALLSLLHGPPSRRR